MSSELWQSASYLSWANSRLSPARLASRLDPYWQTAKHLEYISAKITAAVFNPSACKRIMFLLPPRHGKSTLVSQYTPAWYLDLFPNHNIILTSYEAGYAASWGRKVRDVIEFNPQAFRIRLSQRTTAGHDWQLTPFTQDKQRSAGGMITAGAGGAVTGRGGNLVVIDDPIKNYKEARSKAFKKERRGWYKTTLRTRLEPNAIIVLIMTRWGADDFAGWLMKEAQNGGEPWDVVEFPAEATAECPLGRQVGEPLWPCRYDSPALHDLKKALGPFLYSAIFQQDPQQDEGNLFKRSQFRYYTETDAYYELWTPDSEKPRRVLKTECWTMQSTDPAATEKERADYFVCSTWHVTPATELLLANVYREHANTVKHVPIMRSMFQAYRPAVQLVEKEKLGLAIIEKCILEGMPVLGVPADKSKYARALMAQVKYENGMVYHKMGASWLEDYEDEMVEFPEGEHDDQVDTAAYAALYVVGANDPLIEVVEGTKRET